MVPVVWTACLFHGYGPETTDSLAGLTIAGGLAAIGLATGQAPLEYLIGAAGVMGTEWAADLVERAFRRWCDGWFTENGVLNRDIAAALSRAFRDAVRQLERDWKGHPRYKHLQRTDPEAAERTLEPLQLLRERARSLFDQTDHLGQVLQREEVTALLEQDERGVRRFLAERLRDYFHGHDEELVRFVEMRLADEWLLRFGEALKDPGEEGTRAWRAWQRLWQTSLTAALAGMQQDLAETKQAVAWLREWAERLERLPATERDPTDLEALEQVLAPVRERLDELRRIALRTEAVVVEVREDVQEVLERVKQLQEAGEQARRVREVRRVMHGVVALPPHYVPRERELERLRQALLDGGGVAVTALHGMAGVGKTVLARALALDPACADRYPDGVLWGELGPEAREKGDAEGVLREWAGALGVRDIADYPTPQAKARRLAGVLHGRQLLLVLDDVWHAGPARLLQEVRGPDCGLLVTTRSPKVAAALALPRLSLDVLAPEEALALLATARGRPLAEGELPLAQELVRRLGHHPLGVRLAGAQLGLPGRDWETVLGPLRRRQGEALPALDLSDEEREASLRVCFDLSYEGLSEEDQRRYRWLGVLAPDAAFEFGDVEALWRPNSPDGAYIESARATLRALLDAALLEEVEGEEGPHYRQHPLLREDALRRLRGAERGEALQRHARVYVAVADRAEQARDYRPIARDYAQMEAVLRRVWRAWQHEGDRIGEGLAYPREEAAKYLNSLAFDCENGYWDLQGLYAERLRWLPRAAYVAGQTGNRRDQGAHLGNLGAAYADLGDARRAIEFYQQALAIAREIGDRRGEGNHVGNLGLAYAALGDARRAIEYYEQALEISREIGDRRNEGVWLGNLGLAYADLGEVEKARQCVTELEALGAEEYGTYLNIGNIYSALDDEAAAAQAYSRAIELAPDVGMLYRNRASCYLKLGRLDEAEQDCRKAEELEPDHPYTFARRAEWWREKGEYTRAISAFREALARADRAEWHYDLALTSLLGGDPEAARAAYAEGLKRARGTILRQAIRDLERRLERMPERGVAEEFLTWLKGETRGG